MMGPDCFFNGAQWQDKRQWTQTATQEVQLNMRKHCFTVKVMEHWNRLLREAVEPPSLDISKSPWAATSRWPCFSKGLRDSRRPS